MNEEELCETIKRLKDLRITIQEKEKELTKLKENEREYRRKVESHRSRRTGTRDRDGTPIYFGDTVCFLTKGLYRSEEGTVYKVADNKSRITARDPKGNFISRAPNNVRVIGVKNKHERN